MAPSAEIYLDPPHPGYEKGWDESDDWAVRTDDWPDPLFEGTREECEAYLAAQQIAKLAARTLSEQGKSDA